MKNKEPKLTFEKEDFFYETLRKEVNKYFIKNSLSKKANGTWYLKAWVLILAYIVVYTMLLVFFETKIITFSCYAILGILAILLGLNVGHDAAHNSISKNQVINKYYGFVFDALGGNSYIWKIRHIYAHHPYPNVIGYDSDIKQSKLVRIFPDDDISGFHRFQHLYTPFLLILSYTLNWFLVRDWQDFRVKKFGKKTIRKHPKGTLGRLIGYKTLYLLFILIVPFFIHSSLLTVLAGFLIMNIFSGLIISIALVSTHVGEEHQFPVLNANGNFSHSWSAHQIQTTSDFCTESKFANIIFGGFNHHVIHHLFPEINHVHYVHITPILKKVANELQVNYRSQENILNVFKSHINLLKREGVNHDFFNQEI